MESLEYNLDEEEKRYGLSNKWPTKAKIIIGILIGVIILLIIGFIIYAIKKESDIDDLKDKNKKIKIMKIIIISIQIIQLNMPMYLIQMTK